MLCAPLIISIVVIGLLSNIVQSVTQMKDMALTFVPKIVAVGVIFVFALPWYIQVLQHFTQTIFLLIERATM